jgi:DNA-binding LacI/PurR family transcriptional regulator
MPVTIYDVAKRAGVAASTVSKYMNHGVLRKDVKKRVEEAIQALNYVPNELARGLKTLKTFTIGIIIPTLDSSFTAQIISSIEKNLQQYGYGVIICDCDGKREIELDRLNFLMHKLVDAYILLPSALNANDLKNLDKTVILFDKPIEDFASDSVLIDNEQAGYAATKYLLERGHRDIAILLGGSGVYTSDLRYQGFLKAFHEYGLEPNPDFIIHTDYTVNNSYDLTLELIHRKKRPTAIFTTNSSTTMGCVMALNYLHLSIPEEISVIGFDNLIMAKISNPSLTIVNQPLAAIGKKIAEILLSRINGNTDQPITAIMDFELIEGSSVKQLNYFNS